MIKLNPGEGKTQLNFLDNTGYCAFSRCPAKFCFSSILGLRHTGPAPALDYGTAVHCAMPFLQRGDLAGAIRAFEKSWTESGNEEDSKRNLICASKMLHKWYNERFALQAIPYEIIEPPETGISLTKAFSDQEFAFAVNLDAPFVFAGRCDAVGRDKSTKKLALVEYKTTSELSGRFNSSFDLNSQLIGYSTAISILLNEDVSIAYLEALRVTSANPDNLCIPKFIDKWLMDAFVVDFRKQAIEIEKCLKSGEWTQRFCGCAPYAMFGSHGYQCNYAILCQSPDWRAMLGAFVVDYWEPFKELKDEHNEDKDHPSSCGCTTCLADFYDKD